MSYLNELNPAQKEAVEQIDGPVMIIAGPGSGKTRVLTYRIAHMINLGIDSFRIMALTFTNKAAKEMKERIQAIAGNDARNLYMGTFHSVFARILRIEGPRLGYPSNFSIYDTQDSKSLLKSIIKELGVHKDYYKPSIVFNRISSAKNSLITPEQYLQNIELMAEDESVGRPKLGLIYQTYANRCFQAGAMDFDDLLFKMYQLLKNYPDALYKYQNQFHYVMVDEFQDTNFAQYKVLKMLSDIHENIAVVGDDAQSIYAFRGATIQNILNFKNDYPDLKVFKLEQNYRSTRSIVKAANELIKNNRHQLEKSIWTENNEGDKIRVVQLQTDNEEGKYVADSISEERLRNHFRNRDFGILYRTNAQSRSFEESLRKLNIPYRVYGGLSFYQRKEIKDILAYLKVTVNPKDEESLKRIINYPTRGIGKTTIEKLIIIAVETERSIWEVMENVTMYGFNSRTKHLLQSFVIMIKSFQALMQRQDAYDLALHIGKSTGLIQDLYKDKSVEGLSRYENLQELLNSIQQYVADQKVKLEQNDIPPIPGEFPNEVSLGTYLQEISLLTNADNEEDDDEKVSLMTLHSAKGLEFPVVYIVGLEEELFPSRMSMSSREDLEEERRLFYVGVTRAERKLILSHANSRYKFGQLNFCEPSRFIEEIPSDLVKQVGRRKLSRRVNDSNAGMSDFNKIFGAPASKTSTNKSITKPLPKFQKAPQPIANFKPDDCSNLKTGQEVLSDRFGKGFVVQIEGDDKNKLAVINFDQFGMKRMLIRFAKMKIVK